MPQVVGEEENAILYDVGDGRVVRIPRAPAILPQTSAVIDRVMRPPGATGITAPGQGIGDEVIADLAGSTKTPLSREQAVAADARERRESAERARQMGIRSYMPRGLARAEQLAAGPALEGGVLVAGDASGRYRPLPSRVQETARRYLETRGYQPPGGAPQQDEIQLLRDVLARMSGQQRPQGPGAPAPAEVDQMREQTGLGYGPRATGTTAPGLGPERPAYIDQIPTEPFRPGPAGPPLPPARPGQTIGDLDQAAMAEDMARNPVPPRPPNPAYRSASLPPAFEAAMRQVDGMELDLPGAQPARPSAPALASPAPAVPRSPAPAPRRSAPRMDEAQVRELFGLAPDEPLPGPRDIQELVRSRRMREIAEGEQRVRKNFGLAADEPLPSASERAQLEQRRRAETQTRLRRERPRVEAATGRKLEESARLNAQRQLEEREMARRTQARLERERPRVEAATRRKTEEAAAFNAQRQRDAQALYNSLRARGVAPDEAAYMVSLQDLPPPRRGGRRSE